MLPAAAAKSCPTLCDRLNAEIDKDTQVPWD